MARRERFGKREDGLDIEQRAIRVEHEHIDRKRFAWCHRMLMLVRIGSLAFARAAETKKEGLHLRVTPWFIWWAILGSNQ